MKKLNRLNQIEGRNPVIEALKSGREIEKIIVAKGSNQGSIKKLIGMAKEKRVVVQQVSKSNLDSISQTDNHQGVIAFISAHDYCSLDDILNIAKERGESPFVIILDEIEDPHNLGAIMRTAECAGVHGIIIPKRRSVGLTSTVAKTSAGSIEYMSVARVTNVSMAIDKLKEKGLWIYGADMGGDEDYFKKDLKGAIGIVIGNEGKGISRLVKEKCDFLVKIPMKGKVSSLNASVATSVIVYEVLRQRS